MKMKMKIERWEMERGGSGVTCGIVGELRGRGVKRIGLRGEKS